MNLSMRLRRIALWKKFTCLGLLCLAVILLPTFLYWKEVQKNLEFAAQEQRGLPQAQLILNIIQRTQQHRGLAARFLQDEGMLPREQRVKAEDLEAAIFAYEVYLDKNPNEKHKADFEYMVNYWHNIHRKVAHKKVNVSDSFEQHTALIQLQLKYLQAVVDYYHLSLDPDADGYFLIEASLMRLPELVEILGQIRGYGVGLLSKGDASFEERAHLKALLMISQLKMTALDFSIDRAVEVKKESRENFYQNYQSTKLQYQKAIELVHREILDKQRFTYSAEEFYASFTLGVNSYYGYAHFSIEQLDSILRSRILLNENNMRALLFYVLCSTLFVAFICIRFIRRLLRQLGGEPYYATEVVQAITQGDLACNIETAYADSLLGQVKIMQEKLKENDRLKSEFVSTVSHELRTPLTAIGGALSIVVSGQLGAVSPPALKLLEIAQKNGARLTELVNDLLDIDKLSLGKLELNLSVQPLMPIIDEACVSMVAYAQKYGVPIVISQRFDEVLVKVDARRLRQILVNLLSNAVKFSNKGDDVAIGVSVHFAKVRVEVVDHGKGIPEEFQGRIFERFSQADSSDSRAVGGTGLGLAISKELIQQMSGIIGFTSTMDVGSCFYIELPLEEANSD